MINKKTLERGREAFRQRAWQDAYNQLSDADMESPLDVEDLELLATAAYLTGKLAESNSIWSRAHTVYLKEGSIEQAVRCGFQIGFSLLHKGDYARGGGWIARARSLLDECPSGCVEEGYLLLPVALQSLGEENAKRALAIFEQSGQIGNLYKDRDLMTLSRLGRGQALVRLRATKAGVVLLDEAMAAVDAGEISPIFAGIIYCAVIETCLEVFDLNRAHQWTEALGEWCDAQPQLVPFRGECLVRRSMIMQLHGEWSQAIEEASKATEFLTKSISEPGTSAAFYQFGELHRLRGGFDKAEEAYRQAIQWGQKANPGLALLRLAQGDINTAKTSIESVIKETTHPKNRSNILTAYIEIMLAANNTQLARQAADELVDLANGLNAALLKALAAKEDGAVLLSEGATHKALVELRKAWSIFEELAAPYEIARVRVLVGKAYQALGDMEAAMREFEAAKSTFHQLGATPDISRVDSLISAKPSGNPHQLSHRELEVLHQVAQGLTNKAIANELFISERTVERHVSNIFTKLGVSSRSAVTAYAYEHQLI